MCHTREMSHTVSITVSVDGLSATIGVTPEIALDLLLRYVLSGGTVTEPLPNILTTILTNTERLIQMSGQLETDLATQSAAVQALAAEVTTGLAANAAAIQALKDQIAAGTPVTAADLATLEGNTTAVQAATAALTAALNPPPAA